MRERRAAGHADPARPGLPGALELSLRPATPLLLILLACPGPDEPDDTGDDLLEQWPGQDMDGEPALGIEASMPEAGPQALDVLVANVGNVDIGRCASVGYNLCAIEAEEVIAWHIGEIQPDLVLLSEVTTQAQCEGLADPAEWHVCHPDHAAAEPEQVRRLVGAGYTIACDDSHGFECVAGRVGVVSLQGCADGALCRGLARSAPMGPDCDTGFSLSVVGATFHGRSLDVVNAHPPSGGTAAAAACRAEALTAFLDPDHPDTLRQHPQVLLGGDFNFDPYRDDRADTQLWNAHVSPRHDDPDRSIALHSGPIEHDPPYWTAPLIKRTLDHVASDGLVGRCVTMGAAPGVPPLDLLTGESPLQWLDHLALWCRLGWPG